MNCVSIPCRICNRHINVKEILSPSEAKKISIVGKRMILCFKCGREIFTDKSAQAVACNHCYHRNDLSHHKIKSVFGKNIETHGDLYLKRKGVIEISKIRVGNAIIKGRINGDVYATGMIEILKHGELYGTITCSKFLVHRGGAFRGKVTMLDSAQSLSE
ncbi:MAG: polymer-forming cytoskeletal protein [Candidatus Scalindua sp.]|nr:polymer-forming cytoskeletal protein [Candidatus Scalindua sp.]